MVTIEKLTKRYGSYGLNVSMQIPAGQIVGLVGKNGAGKSTVIKSILGLIHPDSGDIRIFGKDIRQLTIADKERFGVALADSGFNSYFTPLDLEEILGSLYRSFDGRRFEEVCRMMGLPMDRQIKTFSTGMKAKMRVLAALCHEADLLILDEPTAGLDVEARNEILDLLRGYLAERENTSILITSHIATDLENLCDEIYLIHDGEILLHEETDSILSNYGVIKADAEAYAVMDKAYLLCVVQEPYGFRCLTAERQYYAENYPGLIIEKSGIDDLILMLAGGK